jgi:hypothetical protein
VSGASESGGGHARRRTLDAMLLELAAESVELERFEFAIKDLRECIGRSEPDSSTARAAAATARSTRQESRCDVSPWQSCPSVGHFWVSEASCGANSSGPDRARNRDLRNAGSSQSGVVEQTYTGNRLGQPDLHDSGGIRALASFARHLLPRLGSSAPIVHGRRTQSRGAAEGEGRGSAPEAFLLEPRTPGWRRRHSCTCRVWHRVRSPASASPY